MRAELKHIEEIESYLEGQMTPSEHNTFEERIAEDATLSEEVDAQKSIANHFKMRVFALKIEKHQAKQHRRRWLKIILIFISTIAIIGTVLCLLFYGASEKVQKPKKEKQEIVSENYLPTSLSRNNPDSTELNLIDVTKEIVESETNNQADNAIHNDVVDQSNVDDSIVSKDKNIPIDPLVEDKIAFKTQQLWRVNDLFLSYQNKQIIPFRLKSNTDRLKIIYDFYGSRGTLIAVTVHSPSGKTYEIINNPSSFTGLRLKDEQILGNDKGRWEIHIQTKGKGNFDMKIETAE